ncbi:MAG: SDR family NAD(P)-dependent oxidoreductase, partial [Devosia sp.]
MRDKRVLVTGGAGLVGSHIVDLLTEAGAREIVILDNFVRGRIENLASAISAGRVRVVRGDIRDRKAVAEAMRGIDIVFHQAAIRITQCAEDPRLALDVMATGTFNVIEAAVKAGVEKLVAASSASVLGMAEQFPTPESHHPYNNRTIYGAAKAFNEGLLRSFAEMHGLRYVALRYFNVYGPRMDVFGAYTEVLIRWMERLANGQAPVIFGDGLQTMDFVHVRDVARANLLAARATVTDEVFNVASGTETSLVGLAEALARAMEVNIDPTFAPQRKVNPVPRRLADTTRATSLLGFNAQVSLEDGLRDLVAWWRRQQAEKGVI